MIEKKEFIAYMAGLEDLLKREHDLSDMLVKSGFIENHFILTHTHKIINNYIAMLGELSDDKGGWIEWHVWENDFGRKQMEAGFTGRLKPIKTTDQLWDLMKKIGKEELFKRKTNAKK